MGKGIEKTNVMRIIDRFKVAYTPHCYVDSGVVSGVEIAAVMSQSPDVVFKTLVTVGASGDHYVFVIPSNRELDLKKAARSVGEKSIQMLKSKDLLPLTGYIHGGCSPIGMKKFFRTTFHTSAGNYDRIFFSAGKIGYQIEMPFSSLQKAIRISACDIV
jgi:Cys-tRNA(Pro)/Cys-tRNA(Cys) deacylase